MQYILLVALLAIPVLVFGFRRKSGQESEESEDRGVFLEDVQIRYVNLLFGPLSPLGKPEKITLHHTASTNDTVQSIHAYHKSKGWAGIGYHYVVYANGEVWQGRPSDKKVAHTEMQNEGNIGVCFVGNFDTHSMPQKQLEVGKALIKQIQRTKGIKTVTFHKNLKSTNCPGKNFPYSSFLQLS